MILPDRRTLKPLIEQQKYQDAKAGLDLAKKVQALREEYNELRKNREEFLQGTVIEIEKATKTKSDTLNALQGQIEALEAKRKELLSPLNAQWQELELRKQELATFANDLQVKTLKHEIEQQDLEQRKSKIIVQEQRMSLKSTEIERLREESSKEKLEARQILNDAIANRDEIEKECAERLLEISKKENQLDFEKQGLERIKKIYLLKEKELSDRERAVSDKYQQLIRTTKEVNERSNRSKS